MDALDVEERQGVLPCLFCGEPEWVEIHEIWDGHEMQIATCCEGLHEQIIEESAHDPEYRKSLMKQIGVEKITGYSLRRVADHEGQYILDWNLDIRPVQQSVAKQFVHDHHQHCRPPAGWRYGSAIWNGSTLMGVIMVGRPVARMINQQHVVEVNRLAVRRDTPNALRWNACSMAYSWAAREAKKRGFAKIITYTLQSEEGTSLRAAGWTCEGPAGGGSWDKPGRRRCNTTPLERKVRWSKTFRPVPPVVPKIQIEPVPEELRLAA